MKPASDVLKVQVTCSSPATRPWSAVASSSTSVDQGPDRRRRDYAREAVVIEGIIFGARMLVATGFTIYAVRT
ncbi:hypothetical protein ACF1BQ_040875 [Bradyrhizobium sp. RDT10]